MVAEVLGTSAYRPNGTMFDGCDFGANGVVRPGYNGYGYGNYGGYRGYNGGYGGYGGYNNPMIGERMLNGFTRTTAYRPYINDKAEERAIKEAARNVRDTIRIEESGTFSGDFSSRDVQKKWAEFRDIVKESGQYRTMIESLKKEFMDSGLPEDEARKEAEKNASKQLFGLMCELYETHIGVDAKEDIKKHNDYWTNTAKRVDKLWDHLKKISSK